MVALARWLRWLVSLWVCGAAAAQPTPLTKESIAAFEAAVVAVKEREAIPGMAVALGWGGVVRYARGFGLADLEHQVAVTTKTRFRTASIAKAMTAVAVMQLVEQGALELAGDIRRHVPEFPKKRWPVRIEHLLSHQSGIRHYRRPGEATGTATFRTLAAALRPFAADPLRHEPGKRFSYSTYGYTLLGCAIEAAAETSYEEYMAAKVWGPAAMVHTGVDHHFEIIPHRARGYLRVTQVELPRFPESLRERVEVGQILRAPLHDTSMETPGGGVSSTAEDLVRFGMAVLDGTLVTERSREQMWRVRPTDDGTDTGAGLGWFVRHLPGGPYVRHDGGTAGATCMLVIRRPTGVAVAVMCNLQRALGISELAHQLSQLVTP